MQNYDFTELLDSLYKYYDDNISNSLNISSLQNIINSDMLDGIPQHIIEAIAEHYPNFFIYQEKELILNLFSIDQSDEKPARCSIKDEILLEIWLYQRVSQYKSDHKQKDVSLEEAFHDVCDKTYPRGTPDYIENSLEDTFSLFTQSTGLIDFMLDIGLINDFATSITDVKGNSELLSLLLPIFGITNKIDSFESFQQSIDSLAKNPPYDEDDFHRNFLAGVTKYFIERFYSTSTLFSLAGFFYELIQNKSHKNTVYDVTLKNGALNCANGKTIFGSYDLHESCLPFTLPYLSLQEQALSIYKKNIFKLFMTIDAKEVENDIFVKQTLKFSKYPKGLYNSTKNSRKEMRILLQKNSHATPLDFTVFSSAINDNDSIYIDLTKLLLFEDINTIVKELRLLYEKDNGPLFIANHIIILDNYFYPFDQYEDRVTQICSMYARAFNIIFDLNCKDPLSSDTSMYIVSRFVRVAFLDNLSFTDNKIVPKSISNDYKDPANVRRFFINNDSSVAEPLIIFVNPDIVLFQVKTILQITAHIYHHILSRSTRVGNISSIIEKHLCSSSLITKSGISNFPVSASINDDQYFDILKGILDSLSAKPFYIHDNHALFSGWIETNDNYIWSCINKTYSISLNSSITLGKSNWEGSIDFNEVISNLTRLRINDLSNNGK